jgi:DNA repair protein RadC
MPELNHAFYHIKLIRENRPIYHKAITEPTDAVAFFKEQIADSVQEHFVAMFLNARNIPVGWREISKGSVSASLVHPREVFLPAIQLVASSLILAHNHPSGDASPSKDDIELTRRLKQAGELLGIEVLDHLVITTDSHISLKEQGNL